LPLRKSQVIFFRVATSLALNIPAAAAQKKKASLADARATAQEDASCGAPQQTSLRRSGRKGLGTGGAADQLSKVSTAIEPKKRPLSAIVDKTIFEDQTSDFSSHEEGVV
jgi:hypothetical protein